MILLKKKFLNPINILGSSSQGGPSHSGPHGYYTVGKSSKIIGIYGGGGAVREQGIQCTVLLS